MQYENVARRFFGLVTKHACERRTDRRNYDSQDRASIAASRGKNYATLIAFLISYSSTKSWLPDDLDVSTQLRQKLFRKLCRVYNRLISYEYLDISLAVMVNNFYKQCALIADYIRI